MAQSVQSWAEIDSESGVGVLLVGALTVFYDLVKKSLKNDWLLLGAVLAWALAISMTQKCHKTQLRIIKSKFLPRILEIFNQTGSG